MTRRWPAPAALAAAVGVSALSWAGQHAGWVAAGVAAVALALLVPALRVLLPVGVFRARRGIPVAVAGQGLCAALFFTANTYLPLMLTGAHHWSLAAAGLPLVFGSLGWSSASWWQGRHPELPRTRLLRVGFVLLTVAVLGLLLVAPSWGVPWLALPLWAVAGLGMGTCFPSTNLLLLRQSAVAQVGFHTSAAQISSQLGTAIMVGAGGALLATLGGPAVALPVLVAVLAGLGVLGALIAPRALA